jgi:hypothetical protein
MHQVSGVIQAKRIDELTAGRAARRTELLQVAQRNPCFSGELERAKILIGKAAADARELLVRMAGVASPSLLNESFATHSVQKLKG